MRGQEPPQRFLRGAQLRSLQPLSARSTSLRSHLPLALALGLPLCSLAVAQRRSTKHGLFEDRRRRCTDSLLTLNGVVFCLQLLSRGALLAWGAKVNSLIAAGQLWRLLTPALLHGGVVHLLVNCYSLHQIGPEAERLLGPQRFLSLYVFSAVTGNVASFYLSPHPGVGASGAIFGLLGSLAFHFARHRDLLGRTGERQLRSLTFIVALNLLLGAASRGVDSFAHFGGLLGGAAFTACLGPRLVTKRRGKNDDDDRLLLKLR